MPASDATPSPPTAAGTPLESALRFERIRIASNARSSGGMVGGMLGGLLFFIFMLGPLTGLVVRPPGVTLGAAAGATLRGAYVRPLVVFAAAIGAAVWGFPVLARVWGKRS